MTQASDNTSAQAMIRQFDSVIDHGSAAQADALFLDLKQVAKPTRDDIYTLLEERALSQAGKDIGTWNDFQWKQGPKLDDHEYGVERRMLLNDLMRLRPLAQVFYRLSQHATKGTDAWIRNFGEEYAIMMPENKNSVAALADAFAATKRLPAPGSKLAAAHAVAAEKTAPLRDIAQENRQRLKDIYIKRHINTGMRP